MLSINSSSNYYNNFNSFYNQNSIKRNNNLSSMDSFVNMLSSQNNKYQQNLSILTQFNKDSKDFYSNFNDKFSDLKASSNKLKQYGSNSVFNPMGYGSSDNSIVSIKNSKFYDSGSLDISVNKIAQAQTTTTSSLKSSDKNLTGKNNFNLNIDSKVREFNFDFSASTTNKQAMQEIVSKVNDAKIGVTAKIVQKNGNSSLEFKSNKTGKESAFTASFSDKLDTKLSLTTSQKAEDAEYTVDNKKFTSQTNEINLGNGAVTAILKKEGNVTIEKATTNNTNTIDAIKEFTKDYNSVLSFLNENSNKSNAISNLAYSFGTTKFSTKSLSKIGIDVDSKGNLSVDETKLSSVLENNPDSVKNLLGGSSGFASTTYSKTNKAIINSQNLYTEPKINNTKYYNGYTYQNILDNNNNKFNFSNMYSGGLFLNYLI